MKVGTMIYCPPVYAPTPAIREIMATKRDWVWLKMGPETLPNYPASVVGPNDYTYYRALVADLNQRGPARIGAYVGGFDPDSHHPHYDALTEADLLHRPDGSPATQTSPRTARLPNYGSAAVRAKLIAFWLGWLLDTGFVGICLDSFNPVVYADWVRTLYGMPAGSLEGPTHTDAWWVTALHQFTRELRAALAGIGCEVMVNGLAGVSWNPVDLQGQVWGRHNTAIADTASQALAEHFHLVYKDRATLNLYLEMARLIEARGAEAFFFAQPWLFTAMAMPRPLEGLELQRYYLAAYLLMASRGTYYGYNDKIAFFGYDVSVKPAVPYLYDHPDLSLPFGEPVGPVLVNAVPGYEVLYREYTNCWVALNPNEPDVAIPGNPWSPGWGRFGIPGSYRVWKDAGPIDWVIPPGNVGANIAPKSGVVMFR